MICVSVSTLHAAFMDGALKALMERGKPYSEQKPLVDQKNIFVHADIAPSGVALPSAAEGLEGQQSDLVNVLHNPAGKSLESANIPSSDARVVLQQKETEEDLERFGPASEQKPNGDESLNNADLDLKLGRPNPSAGIVRNAEVINGL